MNAILPIQPRASEIAAPKAPLSIHDFVAYMPTHRYVFKPTREMWPAQSVNARLPKMLKVDQTGRPVLDAEGREQFEPAAKWLDQHAAVEQMTWAPGFEMEIEDQLVVDGGWIDRRGCRVFNLYRPPTVAGRTGDVSPWLNHVRLLYGDSADHIVFWLAHRVQRPGEKINHALVLGGGQGIGKDTILEPIKRAVGPWNFTEVSPAAMLGRFNGFLKSVILRVSEARDLGDVDRFAFYDHMKVYTAAPPDVLRVDEKNLREHAVMNVCGVIITTNHKTGGIYLPPDDRRHFVAWSDVTRERFTPEYWNVLYRWLEDGGHEIVADYLSKLGLTGFDPKAPPPHTAAFWEIVQASSVPEDAELADVIDRLGLPEALTLQTLSDNSPGDFACWLQDRRNSRRIPHRLEACGYAGVRNRGRADGLWIVNGKRQVIYARHDLCERDRLQAAQRLIGQ